ncbi:unnamed protein product, partial [Callosobruchus maculatus]
GRKYGTSVATKNISIEAMHARIFPAPSSGGKSYHQLWGPRKGRIKNPSELDTNTKTMPTENIEDEYGHDQPSFQEFDNYMQQDAHEFLNFLINHISEIILAERQQNSTTNNIKSKGAGENGTAHNSPEPTWVHEIFQGILTSETRCLNCENVSSKDEDFFDLQVDIEQNTSITHCLRCFSNTETLCSDNKFKCDNCMSYQEAQKRMRVKKLPMILALHLNVSNIWSSTTDTLKCHIGWCSFRIETF